jgi:hypothetical protein
MDRLDAELALVRWDQASDSDRRDAALYGVAELTAELAALEAEVPAVTEAVCSGTAGIRDSPVLPRAYQAGEAIVSWGRTYPEFDAQWRELGQRALAVMRSLSALDPSVTWSPPMPGDAHAG